MKKSLPLLLFLLSLISPLTAASSAGGIFTPLFTYNSSYDNDQELPTLNQLYEWYDSPSLVRLYLDLNQENLRVYTQMDLHTDLMVDLHHNTFSNLPYIDSDGNLYMDPNIPDIGYIEWQKNGLRLSGGRRKIQIGPGSYALGLASSAPYFDHLALEKEFFMKKGSWTYFFTAITSDRKAMEKMADTEYKTLFAHSFFWKSGRLQIGVTEYNLIYGQIPMIQDMGFNTFYHGYYQDYQNVMDELFFVFEPVTDFMVYGSFISDDYNMAIESSDSNPNGMGLTGGLSRSWGKAGRGSSEKESSAYDHMISIGAEKKAPARLRISFDWIWASKYLYNREDESGKITNPMYYSWEYKRETMNTFFGALYGPDTITSKLSAEWNKAPLKLNASLEWLAAGAEGIDIAYEAPYRNWYALEDPEHTLMVDTAAEWSLSSKESLLGNVGFDIQKDDFDFNIGFGYRRVLF
ncbi:hypothetical protein [Oceanispirochaeta sp.]|jgi:hypothetical protein|uniref:hypothetical protein n=1 Tax=Oceanispirochaeta sp. TaxID=2035350 RepID=UPI002606B655|nr:hypothetical protein [Oceanispirochaeta sp.]MDA3955993.1 hypothetical protein [Oceanispirochaeta sp.]